MRLGVIILAAGASVRMGRPKLLLPWGGGTGTVIAHLLAQWTSLSPAQIADVLDGSNAGLEVELNRIGWPAAQRIRNPDPGRGMFSSVQCAAQWTGWGPDLTHWAVALGDQPLVRTRTLKELLEFATQHTSAVCQPSRNGRGRHPLILPAATFAGLKTSSATDLKQYLTGAGGPAIRCNMDDPGLDLDLDEPGDYERALAQATEA